MTQAFNLSQFANKVNSSGQADATSALTGLVPTANLGTGTANSTTYLAGDQTYKSFPSSFNGATVTSSASDITLTSSSNQLQQVAMTGFGLRVILPDATTITTLGGPRFIISNNGAIAFDIAATDGGKFFGLAGGQTVQISLANNSDSKTGWVATPVSSQVTSKSLYASTNLLSYPISALNSTNSYTSIESGQFNTMSCTALSTTSVLATWIAPTTGYVIGCVGTISGNTISWGTPTTINSARAYGQVLAIAITSTTALVAMINLSGTASYYVIGLAISGTTITPSTISAVGSNGIPQQMVLVGSQVIGLHQGSSSANYGVKVWNYNGASAPTFGTVATFGNSGGAVAANYSAQIVALTSSTFLVTYYDVVSQTGKVRGFSISGATITAGAAAIDMNTNYNYSASLVGISSTEVVFISDIGWQKITVSGTTPTLGSYSFATGGDYWNGNRLYAITTPLISSTDFIGIYGQNGYSSGFGVVRYSYNSTLGSLNQKGYTLCANSLYTENVCTISSTQALVIGLTYNSDGSGSFYPAGYVVALNG